MPEAAMTPRERVLRTLNHEEPDRVPFNLALTVDIYNRLRDHLGLPAEPDKKIGYWTDVTPSLDLLDAMQVDIYRLGLNPPANWQPPDKGDGLLYDEWGIGREKVLRPDGSFYYEMTFHPLKGATLQDVERHPWPEPHDPGRVDGLREKFERARRDTDKAIMAKFSNSIWEQSWWLYGLEAWLVDLAVEPEVPLAIMDKTCDLAIEFTRIGLEAVGDQIDILRLSGEDLGTQISPLISPAMFEQHVRPRFERYWREAKRLLLQKNPSAKLMLHSCGSVRPFIPAWLEMGLDVLDPIQPLAKGMEPDGLKRDFGDRLVFHGGIDIQHALPFGTPDEVKAEVKRYIDALGPGGGYIVAPAHNVQGDVPPENLVAIRDAIAEHGWYPL
jgi:uroporphyrinogen decarboxylase